MKINHTLTLIINGRLTIILGGTYNGNPDWGQKDTPFNKAVSKTFGEQAIVIPWTGGNNSSARIEGASRLAEAIARVGKGEKVNIVDHSHGGNVVKEYTNLPGARKIDNLVNMGTPQRSDYKINADKVGNYFNVFSENDGIQTKGGNFIRSPSHETGPAGRQDPLATPIDASTARFETVGGRGNHGIIDRSIGHSELYTPEVWKQKVDPAIQRRQ